MNTWTCLTRADRKYGKVTTGNGQEALYWWDLDRYLRLLTVEPNGRKTTVHLEHMNEQ